MATVHQEKGELKNPGGDVEIKLGGRKSLRTM